MLFCEALIVVLYPTFVVLPLRALTMGCLRSARVALRVDACICTLVGAIPMPAAWLESEEAMIRVNVSCSCSTKAVQQLQGYTQAGLAPPGCQASPRATAASWRGRSSRCASGARAHMSDFGPPTPVHGKAKTEPAHASINRQTSKFANPQRLSFERAADHYLMSTDEYLTHIPETVAVGVQCLPGATVLLATST